MKKKKLKVLIIFMMSLFMIGSTCRVYAEDDTVAAARAKAAEAEKLAAELEQKVSEIKADLEEKEAELAKAQEGYEITEEAIEQAEAAAEAAKTKLEKAEKDLNNAKETASAAEKEADDAAKTAEKADADYQTAVKAAEAASAEAEKAKSEQGQAAREYENAKAQYGKDSAAYQQAEKNIEDAQKALDQAGDNLAAAKAEKESVDAEASRVKGALDQAEAALKTAEDSYTAAKAEQSAAEEAQNQADEKYASDKAAYEQAAANAQAAHSAAEEAQRALEAANKELTDAKAAAEEANKELPAAEAAVNAAKDAAAAAQAQIALGSTGFFAERDEVANQIIAAGIEAAQATDYPAGATQIGAEKDATSLENMKAALAFIKECNELRASEGVGALKVSDRLMALSQTHVNWSSYAIAHWKADNEKYNVGENLAWGYRDPFDGWYTAEKKIYESGGDGVTGHYTNIINSSYLYTGFAICRTGKYSITHGQNFCASNAYFTDDPKVIVSGEAYTIEKYEEDFMEYYNRVNKALSDAETQLAQAQADLNEILKNIDTSAIEAAETKVAEAQSALEQAQAAAETADTVAAEKESVKNASAKAAEETAQKTAEAEEKAAEAQQAVKNAQEKADAAADAYSSAEEVVKQAAAKITEIEADIAEKQKSVDEAKAAKKDLEDKVENAKKNAEEKMAAAEEAEKALTAANADVKTKKADLDSRNQILAEKNELLAEANEDLQKKQAAYDAALKEYNNASDYYDELNDQYDLIKNLKEQIEKLKKELEQTDEELEEARKELEAAIAELEEAIRKAEEEQEYLESIRIAGEDRFQTAMKIADTYKKEKGIDQFENIILANGEKFADALAGSYLSYVKDAPILITWKGIGEYRPYEQINAYITANLKKGGTVYVLGGDAAVPDSVLTGLEGLNITRLSGADRFETNIAILKEAGVKDEEILVATGFNFADSLSASAVNRPILLVDQELSADQKTYLNTLESSNYYILGGAKAVSTNLDKQLKKYGEVERIEGKDRHETSVAIAKKFCNNARKAVFAYSGNFPDGLCGGPLASVMNAPLLLITSDDYAAAWNFMISHFIYEGYVLGGPKLITDRAAETVLLRDILPD